MAIKKFSPQLSISKDGDSWHALQVEDVVERLSSTTEGGLTQAEANRRLEEFGPNELTEAPPITFMEMLKEQFNNFVVIMLIIAALVSALLGEYIEAGAIMAIVLLNAALGVIQERRAEQALAALRKLAAPEAHVIRDNSRQLIPSDLIVPGDVVLLAFRRLASLGHERLRNALDATQRGGVFWV